MTLKELERKIEQIRPQRLIVLVRTQNGSEKEMCRITIHLGQVKKKDEG